MYMHLDNQILFLIRTFINTSPVYTPRAQSAVGVKNSEDPFAKLSEKIIYEVIFNRCISISLYHKVCKCISAKDPVCIQIHS